MGKLAKQLGVKAQKVANKTTGGRREDEAQEDELPEDEKNALRKIRKGAAAEGSDLTSGGKGGLPPGLVLHVMKRDGFRCKRCGELGDMKENGGIGVHHKSEHLENPKAQARHRLLDKEKRINTPENLVTICERCHDGVHEEDRAEYGDAEQRRHPERH